VADDKAVACEGEVTYTRHDGSKITLPFVNIFEVSAGLITLYRVYIDIAPLFAEQ
jgi:limonene-1,2-epoxide hydrolase